MTLVYLTIAWAVGILMARQAGFAACLAAGGLLGSTALMLRNRGLTRWPVLLACGACVMLGGGRYVLTRPTINAGHLAYYHDNGWVIARGFISAEPSVRQTYTQLELSVNEIERDGVIQPVRGKAILNVPHYPTMQYGDRVEVRGLLETPPIFESFDYREYLASRGVYSLLRRASLTPLEQAEGCLLLRPMLGLKRHLRGTIERLWPNPEAGLLSGILLGLGHTLPTDLAEAFRKVGLTHIMVISGYNISLVMQAVMLTTRRLVRRGIGLFASLIVIGLYTLFVGPSPPVMRAALMGAVFALGYVVGRRSHALTSLAFASWVMLASNPLLLWSVSFQLSFASTLALIVLEPVLAQSTEAWLRHRNDADPMARGLHALREVLTGTLAAQLATLPIIGYHFHEVSLISLLANLLVLPVQPVVMALGAAATVLGTLWLPAGQPIAWLAWPVLRYSVLVIQQLAHIPMAALQISFGAGAVWSFYAAIGLGLGLYRRKDLWARARTLLAKFQAAGMAIAALTLVAILIWSAVFSLPDGRLHVYFLDVGQGDAILLRTPGGRAILVDGGPDPLILTSRLGQLLPFWQRRIDVVVATHGDADHLAGLIPVLERYQVSYVLAPAEMSAGALSARWRDVVEASGARAIPATRGQRVTLGDTLYLGVLHPPVGTEIGDGDDNRHSIVLDVVMDRCRILLTADIDASVEEMLLAAGQPLRTVVLKVAHHGSAGSSSPAFLAAAEPQLAVISVGAQNRFGHPSADVLQRLEAVGCAIYRTDHHGTVEVITDGQSYWVKGRREAH